MLENKLGITNPAELAREEEKISKRKAVELFENRYTDGLGNGTFSALSAIHRFLFEDIYEFVGDLRTVNISKGNFRFASVLYLKDVLERIENMPQNNFNEIIEKYVEMNIAYPFREGNGCSMRIWLDLILKKELNKVIDWSAVDKNDYFSAMERGPVNNTEIKLLLEKSLTGKTDDGEVYIKGIDISYYYEGYANYDANKLK